MSKDQIPDYSDAAEDNEDIGGIGIKGTDKVSNFRKAFQTLMKQLKQTSTGTNLVEDTWAFGDPVDLTKRARLDAGNVTAGETRVLTMTDYNLDLTGVPHVNAAQSFSAAEQAQVLSNIGAALRGHIFGLTLSNAADTEHDITAGTGEAVSDDAASPVLITLSSSITKQFDATFAAGTGAGGMVSGESLPTSGTVHVWLIMKADGTVDMCANNNTSSGLSPTLPTGFIYKRRIGSLRTDASANIRNFVQVGDEFILKIPVQDSTTTGLGATAVTFSCSVPSGVVTTVIGTGFTYQSASANVAVNLTCPDETDASVSGTYLTFNSPVANVPAGFGVARIRTNSSGQIRVRAASANTAFTWNTRGWVDTRGRFA